MIDRLLHIARQAWRVVFTRIQMRSCTSVGRLVRAEGRLLVSNAGTMHIGNHVRLRGTHVPVELATFPTGTLKIGDHVFINSGVSICAEESVTIGNHVAIGNYTLIMDTDFHAVEDHRARAQHAPIVIEDNVWIAARVTILKGVTIGHGAVVAAGAVVTRDVPPYTLVGGVPAKTIRKIEGASEPQGEAG